MGESMSPTCREAYTLRTPLTLAYEAEHYSISAPLNTECKLKHSISHLRPHLDDTHSPIAHAIETHTRQQVYIAEKVEAERQRLSIKGEVLTNAFLHAKIPPGRHVLTACHMVKYAAALNLPLAIAE